MSDNFFNELLVTKGKEAVWKEIWRPKGFVFLTIQNLTHGREFSFSYFKKSIFSKPNIQTAKAFVSDDLFYKGYYSDIAPIHHPNNYYNPRVELTKKDTELIDTETGYLKEKYQNKNVKANIAWVMNYIADEKVKTDKLIEEKAAEKAKQDVINEQKRIDAEERQKIEEERIRQKNLEEDPWRYMGGRSTTKRKSTKRKSTKRKTTKRKSTKRKSTKRLKKK
jgi:hypothetical protein